MDSDKANGKTKYTVQVNPTNIAIILTDGKVNEVKYYCKGLLTLEYKDILCSNDEFDSQQSWELDLKSLSILEVKTDYFIRS